MADANVTRVFVMAHPALLVPINTILSLVRLLRVVEGGQPWRCAGLVVVGHCFGHLACVQRCISCCSQWQQLSCTALGALPLPRPLSVCATLPFETPRLLRLPAILDRSQASRELCTSRATM
jgi:hypothetical protein